MKSNGVLLVVEYDCGDKFLEYQLSEEEFDGIKELKVSDQKLLCNIIEIAIRELFLEKGIKK